MPVCTHILLQSTPKQSKELGIGLYVAEAFSMLSCSTITGQITLQIKRDSP